MMTETPERVEEQGKPLSALLTESSLRLKNAGLQTHRLDAEVLLCRALGMSRETFWRDSNREIGPGDISRCDSWIRRRENREPLAYIIEEREFWSRTFRVTPDVLIPRPESEIIIEQLLNCVAPEARNEALMGMDLCTGSGVLAIIAALELPHSRITGVDVSPPALDIARENARRHGVDTRLDWVECDLLQDLELDGVQPGSFDFILCNPPYLSDSECAELQPEIKRFEPDTALKGGSDGMKFYPPLIKTAARWLKTGGLLLMEIGASQGFAVGSQLEASGSFGDAQIFQDYAGQDRVVFARKDV